MIRFALKCEKDHQFESWFQSSDAFDKLLAAGMVTCAVCGSDNVEKALMAPRVQESRKKASSPTDTLPAESSSTPLSSPQNPAEAAMAEMRRQIEEKSEYVGLSFAKEARDIHTGDAPDRLIHGEAKPEDAKALIEEGIPVTPLPFNTGRKTN